ncbi:MAG: MFS transporter, partial [bacterium]
FPGYNLLHYLHNREMDELYLATFVKTLARSLVLVFIPIYLLTIGFSVRFIALFFLLEFAGMVLATPLGLWLNSQIGVKKTMAVADLIFIAYMFAVGAMKGTGAFLILPTLLISLSSGLFWAGYHVDFTTNVDNHEEGSEISFLKVVILLSSAIGPFIGSLLIVGSSFQLSFSVAAGMCLLAIFPLFITKDFKTKPPVFSLKRLMKIDDKVKARSYMAFGMMQIANETFWPLFIYLTLKSLIEVGALFSITTVLMVLILIRFGHRVDRHPNKSLTFGVWLHAPSWILRIFIATPIGALIMNAYAQLSYQLLDVAFEKVIYTEARQSNDIASYFLFRQLSIGVGRFLVCALILATGKIEYGFILTFLAVPLYLGLRNRAAVFGSV